MKPKIALSTCWCSHRHIDGFEMAREMAGLGFEYIELSHGIRISLVPGILKALEEGLVKISSVHNFCPLPTGVMHAAPNIFLPTSGDRSEIASWIRYTRRTIEFAAQVKADRIILHCGKARFSWFDPEKTLQRFRSGKNRGELSTDPRYLRLLKKCLAKVMRKKARYMNQLRSSLEAVIPLAQERGIRLGLENRESLVELPLDAEMAPFLEKMGPSGVIGYWHDTGHARLKEILGIISQERLLSENQSRLLGFHLHDVDAHERDHQPIGSGGIDFKKIACYFQPGQVLVLEMSPHLKEEQITESRYRLECLLANNG